MNLTIPKVGLRTIKTAVSVFLCLLLFPNEPFFACLTAVICVQDTVASSVKMAINRAWDNSRSNYRTIIFNYLQIF